MPMNDLEITSKFLGQNTIIYIVMRVGSLIKLPHSSNEQIFVPAVEQLNIL